MLWTLLVVILILAIFFQTPYAPQGTPVYVGNIIWLLVLVLLVYLLIGILRP